MPGDWNSGGRTRIEPREERQGVSETDSGGVCSTSCEEPGGDKVGGGRCEVYVVVHREGRCASSAPMRYRYVRANMEDPVWVSEVLVEVEGRAIDSRDKKQGGWGSTVSGR